MTVFDQLFETGSEKWPIVSERYHLLWAMPCPFASRAKIALDLLGLDAVISVGEADPINEDVWSFSHYPDGKEPTLQVANLKDVYSFKHPEMEGPWTIPVLIDKESGEVVRQQSAEIVRDFTTAFRSFHSPKAPDLYPEALRDSIDKANTELPNRLNRALFGIAGAKIQKEYDDKSRQFFEELSTLNEHFAKNTYYHGDPLTETDIFIYVILVRFDQVYAQLFQANAHQLSDFPHLWDYLRHLYQIPAFKKNTNFDRIKAGAFLGKHGRPRLYHPVVPAGPSQEAWEQETKRTHS